MTNQTTKTIDDDHALSETTVFFSYSRIDQAQAIPIINAIEAAGFRVWWDGMLSGGTNFLETTEQALESARAVVVLWSHTSVKSHWVLDEATSGRERSVLVPLSLDGTMAPLGFRQVQIINLENQNLDNSAVPIQNMLSAVRELHDGIPLISAAPQLTSQVADTRNTSRRISRRYVFLGGGLLLGAGVMSGLYNSGVLKRAATVVDNSLAVLPFENLSGDPQYDYIANGLSAEIRNSLSLNPALKVAAKSSSQAAVNEGLGVAQISKKLGVSNLIEGSFSIVGNAVKVTVNFIDGQSGFNQWVKQFEHSVENILSLHDDITAAVQETYSMDFGNEEELLRGQTQNPAAFNEYLKGVDEVGKSLDMATIRRAITHFQNAIDLDPQFGVAYVSLSQLLLWQKFSADTEEEAQSFGSKAIAAAEDAIRVNPKFADAHNNLGYIQFFTLLDVRNAKTSFATAKEIGIEKSGSLARYATFSAHIKNDANALPAANKARALDPLNPAIHETLGYVHYCAGRFGEAIESYERALGLRANHSGAFALMANAQFALGNIEKGLSLCEKEKRPLERLPCLAIGLDNQGLRAESQTHLDEIISFGDIGAYQQAQVYANRNDIEKTEIALKKAYELNDSGLALLYIDPNMASMAKNPIYLELLAKIGFTG